MSRDTKLSVGDIERVERKLANGLTVVLVPRPGFQQTFAMFATKYGSIDNMFVQNGQRVRVPDGIAHFLEHKMFEDEEKEVFSQFAEHGASVNAYTTFDHTTYYFSGTSDLRENINTLLDFVQSIYLTDENVEKEKGIIAQEIRMGEDDPDRRVFMDLLSAMYANHPVRIDIAGSVESIQEIDRSTLLACYHTFYHPSNMLLVIAGGFDPTQMMAWIEENQQKKTFAAPAQLERIYPEEPQLPGAPSKRTELPVSLARCLIGWKETELPATGDDLLRQELLTGLVLDVLFGRTSPFYAELLEAGLIDKGFSWEYELTPQYGYTLIGGNAPEPQALYDRVKAQLATIQRDGIDEVAFARAQKKAIGRFIMGLDQVSYIARSYTAYRLREADFFKYVPMLQSLTVDDAKARLQQHLNESQMVVSMVLPKAH